jgi:hypothetical protein
MNEGRYGAVATVLPNRKVLIAGGAKLHALLEGSLHAGKRQVCFFYAAFGKSYRRAYLELTRRHL